MEIKKIKNVGGIKNLHNLGNLEKDVIIYAPNGGGKTSLAYGLNTIANGGIPEERISGTKSEYELMLNGKTYTNKNPQATNAMLVYNFDIYQDSKIVDSVYEKKYSLLTVSKKMKNIYDREYEECAKKIEELKNIISPVIANKKRDAVVKTEEFFANCLNKNNWNEIISYLSSIDWENVIITDISLLEILNNNTKAIISDSSFTDKIKQLDESIKLRALSNLFGDTFGPSQVEELIRVFTKDGFFEAGHLLELRDGSKIDSCEKFVTLYKSEVSKIYADDDTKKSLEELSSKINKNKDTRNLNKILNDYELLPEMKNYDSFVEKLLAGKLNNYKEIILSTNQIINDTQKKLQDLVIAAEKESTIWKKVCNEFKNRFDVPFEICIKDSFECVVGRDIPKFYFKYGDKEIEESKLLEILSTGEKRALTVLNFLFDLEVSYSDEANNEILIVLDDVVDSFDYKNKYAIIQYIKDIQCKNNANNKRVYTWVLTHNFDFFSTFKLRTQDFKAYFICKNKDSEDLKGFNKEEIEGGLTFFRSWFNALKKNFDVQKFLALIPVCRNIIEFTKGKENKDYITLCSVLHWREDTCKIKVKQILDIYNSLFGVKVEYNEDKTVYDLLQESMEKIKNSKVNHDDFDLDAKLIYSINIRRILERIFNLKNPRLINSSDSLGKEYDSVKDYFNDDEKKLIIKAMIIIPEFIHLNSFMYEPLMDVGLNNLKKIYNEIYNMGTAYGIDECPKIEIKH